MGPSRFPAQVMLYPRRYVPFPKPLGPCWTANRNGLASVAPATLSALPSGRLPPTTVSAVFGGSRQIANLAPGAQPRAGTALTYSLVPRTNSATEAHPRQLLDGTALRGDSLRRFPEHFIGRARRCFEELLDRAVFHMPLRLGPRRR